MYTLIATSRFSFQGPKGPQVSIMPSLSLFSRSFRAHSWTQMFQVGVTAPGKEHDFRLCFCFVVSFAQKPSGQSSQADQKMFAKVERIRSTRRKLSSQGQVGLNSAHVQWSKRGEAWLTNYYSTGFSQMVTHRSWRIVLLKVACYYQCSKFCQIMLLISEVLLTKWRGFCT